MCVCVGWVAVIPGCPSGRHLGSGIFLSAFPCQLAGVSFLSGWPNVQKPHRYLQKAFLKPVLRHLNPRLLLAEAGRQEARASCAHVTEAGTTRGWSDLTLVQALGGVTFSCSEALFSSGSQAVETTLLLGTDVLWPWVQWPRTWWARRLLSASQRYTPPNRSPRLLPDVSVLRDIHLGQELLEHVVILPSAV